MVYGIHLRAVCGHTERLGEAEGASGKTEMSRFTISVDALSSASLCAVISVLWYRVYECRASFADHRSRSTETVVSR